MAFFLTLSLAHFRRQLSFCAYFSLASVGLIGAVRCTKGVVRSRAGIEIAFGGRLCHWLTLIRLRSKRLALLKSRFCGGDEAFPNFRRQRSSGHPVHRRTIVVPNPDANHKLVRETNKPGVTVVLAGASLSRDGFPIQGCAAARATLDHFPQELG